MSDLRISITLLVAYIIALLGLANIDEFQQSVIDFNPSFFVLIALIVFVELIITGALIKQGVRITAYMMIVFWLFVYILIWWGYWGNSRPLQVHLIQLLLASLAAGLSFDVGRRIGQVDRALDGLSNDAYPNRSKDINSARDEINEEITRSRRYKRPLALMTLRLGKGPQESVLKDSKALEKDLLERFALAKAGQIISDLARNTDMVLKDSNGMFILLCPETEGPQLSLIAERIKAAIQDGLNIQMEWGGASFPDEAITFDDLLSIARRRAETGGS